MSLLIRIFNVKKFVMFWGMLKRMMSNIILVLCLLSSFENVYLDLCFWMYIIICLNIGKCFFKCGDVVRRVLL